MAARVSTASFTVATFNLHRGTPARAFPATLDRLAAADIDILLIQEADRKTPRNPRTDHVAAIAEAMGAEHAAFLPARGRLRSFLRVAGPSQLDGTGQGIGIVSRFPVLSWSAHDLRTRDSLVKLTPWRLHVDQPRQLLLTRVAAPGGELTVACTHLSWQPEVSRDQLFQVEEILRGEPGPYLLGGDFNQRANRTSWPSLAEHLTFPSATPRHQIDHLVGDIVSGGSGVLRMPVSDHLLLWSRVMLRSRGSEAA